MRKRTNLRLIGTNYPRYFSTIETSIWRRFHEPVIAREKHHEWPCLLHRWLSEGPKSRQHASLLWHWKTCQLKKKHFSQVILDREKKIASPSLYSSRHVFSGFIERLEHSNNIGHLMHEPLPINSSCARRIALNEGPCIRIFSTVFFCTSKFHSPLCAECIDRTYPLGYKRNIIYRLMCSKLFNLTCQGCLLKVLIAWAYWIEMFPIEMSLRAQEKDYWE